MFAGLIAYKTVHIYGDLIRTEPNCHSGGAIYRICSVCGKVKVEEILPCVGHFCAEWILEEPPTAITDGRETGVCTRCGQIFERTVPRLTEQFEQQMPRLELTANASGVSTTDAVSGDFTFHFRFSKITGAFQLKYLPPDDLTPHDYAMSVISCQTDVPSSEPTLQMIDAGTELYVLADHADPLHIRADAASRLFLDSVSQIGGRYAALLTLPNGIGYFGTRLAFYQNGIYLEPRTLCLSPAAYCSDHPDITAAVVSDGSVFLTLFGDHADDALRTALEKAQSGEFSDFDTEVLAAYLVFADSVRLNDAFCGKLLWVYSDGIWYPLPQSMENCLGAEYGAAGLCDCAEPPTATGNAVSEAFWSSVRRELAPQIASAKETLSRGALSSDAVAQQLRGVSDALPEEFCTHARNADENAKRAEGGSIDDILIWYAGRNA